MSLIGFFLLGDTEILLSQNDEIQEIVNDSKREEVQRYFGYELLLYRYLTLPYDISVNINEHGLFVEIGFIYILFIPILLLLISRRKLKYLIPLVLITLFSWVISTSNSFVYSNASQIKIETTKDLINEYMANANGSEEPVAFLVGNITKFSLTLYEPLNKFGNWISGNKDHVTYPILMFGFLGLILLIHNLIRDLKTNQQYLIIIFSSYAFFWFAFAGGIIWYGYILLFLAYFLIHLLINVLIKQDYKAGLWMKRFFLGFAILWIGMGFLSRVSNIQSVANPDEIGKGIFNPVFYEYGLGKINDTEVKNKIYPNVTTGLDAINRDKNALVWRVGTSLTYFIDNNTERVVMDNQLGRFQNLRTTYPDNNALVDAFLASNIKYLIVDLNTAQIDKTPQRTLTAKYRELERFIQNNPRVQLISTDRILQRRNSMQNIEYFYGDFGQVYLNGYYAIYQFIR
ncbi:MAG: hypothetical protein HKN09_09575 [Saprospiraceae bacterium]|nr:hypothetical protein [Saprospiraceae bacterium]